MDLTDRVEGFVSESGIKNGFLLIWEPHTTATLAVNEADPDLWQDILDKFKELVPVQGNYRHNKKYGGIPREQNAHAHILNCLSGSCLNIPLMGGRLALGTWQRILFIELDGPRSRRVLLQAMGMEE